jgi:hypothetical protein
MEKIVLRRKKMFGAWQAGGARTPQGAHCGGTPRPQAFALTLPLQNANG